MPLGIVATDLNSGRPVTFHGKGDVVLAHSRQVVPIPDFFFRSVIKAGCWWMVLSSMEVPAEPLLQMGADRIISVAIPNQEGTGDYGNMLSVVSRCFQIMTGRTQNSWRRYSSVVIAPPVADMAWDSFASAKKLIQLGEQAARAALPSIQRWLASPVLSPDPHAKPVALASQFGAVTATSGHATSTTQIQS